MTNPLNSFQTNFGRFYAHPSSGLSNPQALLASQDMSNPYSPKPSVTNIIGMMDKKFLPAFYAKLVAEHAVANLETIRYQAETFGPEVAIGSLKTVPNMPNRNASIGDEIHAAIDSYVQGVPVTEFATSTAEAMYRQWLGFIRDTPIDIVRSEFTVWSYKHGYAGTGDLMWRHAGKLWIVDTKSGNRVYPEVAMQTSALAHADVILDSDGNESEMPASDFQGVMHIRPRSVRLYRLDRTDEAFETFLACKRLFDWKRFDAPKVIGTPLVESSVKKGSDEDS